jgi:Ohr subfamily peroxiredoxin
MSVSVKYTAAATASGGGRDGRTVLDGGALALSMVPPKDLGGSGLGHNPEQLFALGYAACYLGAMRFAAGAEKLGTVPADATVHAVVGIGPRAEGGFGLTVRLEVAMPGLDRATAERIAERGHFICPYSHATRGNIAVETVVV